MIDMSTLSHDMLLILALINLVMCLGIAWSCLCRLAAMSGISTKLRFRINYTLILVCSMSSGFSPVLFREYPGPGSIMLAFGILYMLGIGYGTWKNGVPMYARSDVDSGEEPSILL